MSHVQDKDSKNKGSPKEAAGTHSSTIMRHTSHELTSVISEVYHERNIGLGLAPPLSTLLLENDIKNEEESIADNSVRKYTMKSYSNSSKPWLNVPPLEPILDGKDMTTEDNLEKQNTFINKTKVFNTLQTADLENLENPDKFDGNLNEFLKRDEGDGRSVADSQCSSNYKGVAINSDKSIDMVKKMQMMSIKSNVGSIATAECADKGKKSSSKIVKKCLYRKKYSDNT